MFLDLTEGEVQKQAASIDLSLELQAQTHFPAEIYATGRFTVVTHGRQRLFAENQNVERLRERLRRTMQSS